jgi:muconolactone delta-isomerase
LDNFWSGGINSHLRPSSKLPIFMKQMDDLEAKREDAMPNLQEKPILQNLWVCTKLPGGNEELTRFALEKLQALPAEAMLLRASKVFPS